MFFMPRPHFVWGDRGYEVVTSASTTMLRHATTIVWRQHTLVSDVDVDRRVGVGVDNDCGTTNATDDSSIDNGGPTPPRRHATPAAGDTVVTNLLTTAVVVLVVSCRNIVAVVSVRGHRCHRSRRDVGHRDIVNDHRRACAAPRTATMYVWRHHTTVVACRSIVVDAEVAAP